MTKLLLARHEENMDWYVVAETGPGAFECLRVAGDQIAHVKAPFNFQATHRHYKGRLYAKYGETILPGTQTIYVVYGDESGLNWLREKEKFDGSVGKELRFTPWK